MGGLWKLPELWTRKRTRAHKLLGRRQTDAGAHRYHSPRFQVGPRTGGLYSQPPVSDPAPWWPVFTRPRVAGFEVSTEVQPVRDRSYSARTFRVLQRLMIQQLAANQLTEYHAVSAAPSKCFNGPGMCHARAHEGHRLHVTPPARHKRRSGSTVQAER